MWSNMSLHVYLIYVSLYSISNHIPKVMDLDLEPVFLIESLCFSFFVGVGWDGVGGNTMSNLSIGGF